MMARRDAWLGTLLGRAAIVATVWGATPAPAADTRPLAEAQKACDKGDLKSCNNLGLRYAKGDAAPKNLLKAFGLFTEACQKDLGVACLNLGVLHATGQGAPPDPARAAELFGQACDKGEGRGCRLRGQLLYHGKGLAKDLKTAAGLFSMACDLGDMPGCQAAAIQLVFGHGVKKDGSKANALFRKACDGGVTEACDSLRRRRRALIWRVAGPKPSFLVPLLTYGFAIWDLPEKTRATLDGCDTLVTLADYSDVDRKNLRNITKLGSGQHLGELVSKEVINGLEKELGVAASELDALHPGALAATVLAVRNPTGFGLLGQIAKRALRKGRKPIYLTTPTEIARRMSEADVHAYAGLLDEVVLHRKRSEKVRARAAAAFRLGDEAMLKAWVFSPRFMQLAGALIDPIVRAPEEEWVGALRGPLKKGSVCVALPAAHFLGANNMRDKLARAGFAISRVGGDGPEAM